MATLGPPAWDLRGDVRCDIAVADVDLVVLADVVHDECVRRGREGPAAGALDWRALGALSLLPHGVAIPWAEVDLDTRLLVDGLPRGAVHAGADHVLRRWRPALELRALAVVSAAPRPALDDVSMFAAVAPCLLLLTAAPADPVSLACAATRAGVGVAVDTGDGVHPVSGPPSVAAVRDDPRRWEVAETVYATLQAGSPPRRPAPVAG